MLYTQYRKPLWQPCNIHRIGFILQMRKGRLREALLESLRARIWTPPSLNSYSVLNPSGQAASLKFSYLAKKKAASAIGPEFGRTTCPLYSPLQSPIQKKDEQEVRSKQNKDWEEKSRIQNEGTKCAEKNKTKLAAKTHTAAAPCSPPRLPSHQVTNCSLSPSSNPAQAGSSLQTGHIKTFYE